MKRSEIFFSAITVPLDYLTLILAGVCAYWLRYWPSIQAVRPVIFNLPFAEYVSITASIAAVWVLFFALTGLYSMKITRRLADILSKIVIGCSAGLAFVLAVMVFSRYLFDSRFIILASWVLAVLFVFIERFCVRIIQRWLLRYGVGTHRVILLGSGAGADKLSAILSDEHNVWFRLVEQITNFDSATTVSQLRAMHDEDKFDEIIHINPHQRPEETMAILDFVSENHIGYQYSAGLLDAQLSNFEMKTIGDMPLIEIKQTRLDGWGRVAKRLFDIIAGLILIIILSPIMLLVVIAIKLDSRGPIFFAYKRIGQFGKSFTYFKFRSMIHNAHKLRFDHDFQQQHENVRAGTPMIKFKDDPRITRVGKLIRRWSIDELPELFLVVWGTMSLVGPRPHEVEEVEQYQKHHKKLLTIKPGMTGLAQVSGRSDLDFEQEVKLDTFYIEQWTLWLDILILLRTPFAVLRRRATA